MLGPLGLIPRELLPDWVICGGESGPGARKVWRAWIYELREQCAEAGVPFFFKQWGGRNADAGGCELDGAEIKQWPRAAYGGTENGMPEVWMQNGVPVRRRGRTGR